MAQKISNDTEQRMVSAIEKAASMVSGNPALDLDATLASRLQEANVPERFGKVATAAFNKRLTVLTFQKTADEERDKPFALADEGNVLRLLGSSPLQAKAASISYGSPSSASALFTISHTPHSAPMQKAASAPRVLKRANIEERLNMEQFQEHIGNMIDKHAALYSLWQGRADTMETNIEIVSQELAKYFGKTAADSYEFTTLKNLYGDKFEYAIGGYMPESTDFEKTASAAIKPNGWVYNKTAALLDAIETHENICTFLDYYNDGLLEFCKTAARTGAVLARVQNRGLGKNAGIAGAASLLSDATTIGTDLLTTGANVGIEGVNTAGRMADTSVRSFDTSRSLHALSRFDGMSPSQILDSEFLIRDRFYKRMLAWSDMSADPEFSMYPSEQVFQATQKALDMDTTMEDRDHREMLRANVGQLLAQNNRATTADIASVAKTLSDISKIRSTVDARNRELFNIPKTETTDSFTMTLPAHVDIPIWKREKPREPKKIVQPAPQPQAPTKAPLTATQAAALPPISTTATPGASKYQIAPPTPVAYPATPSYTIAPKQTGTPTNPALTPASIPTPIPGVDTPVSVGADNISVPTPTAQSWVDQVNGTQPEDTGAPITISASPEDVSPYEHQQEATLPDIDLSSINVPETKSVYEAPAHATLLVSSILGPSVNVSTANKATVQQPVRGYEPKGPERRDRPEPKTPDELIEWADSLVGYVRALVRESKREGHPITEEEARAIAINGNPGTLATLRNFNAAHGELRGFQNLVDPRFIENGKVKSMDEYFDAQGRANESFPQAEYHRKPDANDAKAAEKARQDQETADAYSAALNAPRVKF